MLFPMYLIGFSDGEKPDDIFNEALQMHDLDHRNVMSLVGVYFIKSDPCIVMPYMENGSLLTHLKNERSNLIVSETASERVSFNIVVLESFICHEQDYLRTLT